jgi:transposase
MLIIGCDFHPSWEQVAWLDTGSGETAEQKLLHSNGEAEQFYGGLAAPALIGLEATGNCHWLLDRLRELGHEVWVGDAAAIRASYVRRQKTDRRDAAHILKLLVEGRFPRLWVPEREQRDLRQLLIHRHKLVEIRSRVKNGLQHLALNQGMQRKQRLWSAAGQQALRGLPLQPWASRRREGSLGVAGSAGGADRAVGPSGSGGCRTEHASTSADASAGGGSDHGAGLCADPRGGKPLSTRQAGGQLSGIDSPRTQFRRSSAAGRDQQAGESISAHAAGGSGAVGGSL